MDHLVGRDIAFAGRFQITSLPDGTFDLNFLDREAEVGDSLTFDEIEDAKRAALEATGATEISWVSPSPSPEGDA